MEATPHLGTNWSRTSALSLVVAFVLQIVALAVDSTEPSESEFKNALKFYIHAERNPVPEQISKDPSKAVFEIIKLWKAQDDLAQKNLCFRALGRTLATFKVTEEAATAARKEIGNALKSDNAVIRESAMWTITILDKAKATDVLLSLVDDPNYTVEAEALDLLGYYGDPKMAPGLLEILKRRSDAAKDIPERAATEHLFQVEGAEALAKMRARGSNENLKP